MTGQTTADANRASIRYAREGVWGETPASPAMKEMRITGESLRIQKRTEVSREVRADRQRPDMLEVGRSADGAVRVEMSYGAFEPFLEGAMRHAVASAAVQGSLTFGASTITAGGPTAWDGFKVGQWVRVHNAAPANNGPRQIVSISSSILGVTGGTGQTQTVSATVNGRTLVNGTAEDISFVLEGEFADVDAVKVFTGMVVDRMQLQLQTQAVVSGVFQFIGKDGAAQMASVAGSVAPASTTPVMTASRNVAEIREGGAPLASAVRSLNVQIANNGRTRAAVGARSPAGIGSGGVDVTGSMEVYFDGPALYQKFLSHVSSSLGVKLADEAGNVMVLTLPRIFYSAGDPQITGIDADVFLPLTFAAVADPATGITLRIDLLPATV